MAKKSVRVNIYNFIRMSHTEPSRFIQDDFDTISEQIITVKQFGFPGTYSLKYDALMEPRYQELMKRYLDDSDEISAWWEITGELCARSGVAFRDSSREEEYDDRVNSAYSLGYTPEERKKLVDGYMADFYDVFGKYPQSIGSWVLDSVTMEYAAEKYGVSAYAICRDQIGVDGFTLWGGYPNGAYYPSRRNEYIPAQDPEEQIPAPVFRLLGPDPIYNFEAEVRDDLAGVYSLEPAWITGRDEKWIGWLFGTLTREDALGMGYAQVGQENNFLWENIRPGFAPQLKAVKELQEQGLLRVETMAQTANYFRGKYRRTPPMTFQASGDWSERGLSCQWYACAGYRAGYLGEGGRLRIRDLFMYDQACPSPYLTAPMKQAQSTFEALPVMYPQAWRKELGQRPFIRFLDEEGKEPVGRITYTAPDELTARAELTAETGKLCCTMHTWGIEVQGARELVFDALPVFRGVDGDRICMCREGHPYSIRVAWGSILEAGLAGVRIGACDGTIRLELAPEHRQEDIFSTAYLRDPGAFDREPAVLPEPKLPIPPFEPAFFPGDSVFPWGTCQKVSLTSRDGGTIHFTLDGSRPDLSSDRYTEPVRLEGDTLIRAIAVTPDGRISREASACYRFALKELSLESPTRLDKRPVFYGKGIEDLLGERRGSTDYLDGRWRGTLDNIDIICVLPGPRDIAGIYMGFLTHHRSGIVYPERLELYIGPDKDHLALFDTLELPKGPEEREIVKRDFGFRVHRSVGAFCIVARRYERMPQWCAYRGTATVFTMADSLMVVPE